MTIPDRLLCHECDENARRPDGTPCDHVEVARRRNERGVEQCRRELSKHLPKEKR